MPEEHRHWQDALWLSLQRAESAYNVLVDRWDVSTVTLMSWLDDETVHEQWDDVVAGMDLVREGYRLPNAQAITRASAQIPFRQPRVTAHTLAGLLGLSLGRTSSVKQPLFTAYRHWITLAGPTELLSISARTSHQQNRFYAYGGLKSQGFTLENNGPYVQLTCPLVGAGSRTDITDAVHVEMTFHPPVTATHPTSQRMTDALGGFWYMFPDGAGGLTVDTTPPAGIPLVVGTGLSLLAFEGGVCRLGIATDGTLEVTPLTAQTPSLSMDVCILDDSTGLAWYLWIEEMTVTLGTQPPPFLPGTSDGLHTTESWLRWGDGRFWLADALTGPLPAPMQPGQTNLGPSAVEISSRVLRVSVQEDNGLLATEAYRVSSGMARSNFHAAAQRLSVTLALQVDTAEEARDLAAYLTQRPLAFEWQSLGPPVDVVTVTDLTTGTVPDYHRILDPTGTVWYLQVNPLGEYSFSSTLPSGLGLAVNAGLTFVSLDGYRYALGVTPTGEVRIPVVSFAGTPQLRIEFCRLRDTTGVPWLLWIEPPGMLVVDRTAQALTPWQQGLMFVCPRLQYRALRRTMQSQHDVLELTGTVEEALPYPPVVAEVVTRTPAYLQRG